MNKDEAKQRLIIFAERKKQTMELNMDGMKKGMYKFATAEIIAYAAQIIAVKKIAIDRDVVGAKQMFYLSAKSDEAILLAEPYNTPDHPRYSRAFISRSGIEYFPNLMNALISQHRELIDSMAHLIGWKDEQNLTRKMLKDPINRAGFVVKYLILGKDQEAREHLDALKSMKIPWRVRILKEAVVVLEAILENRPEQVESGLKRYLEREEENAEHASAPDQKLCSISAMGFGWLARYRGMDVSVDHPLAPKEVFTHHEIEYPNTDFLPVELRDKTWRDVVGRS
ncbi:hypothetical protein [Kroppenstedtia sanguinis]|uniref:Uncharacterized protein n=1 Tax=Kroppenstedtia sanguinis TaxID=1380684 RepID=A0ABW4CBZ0_9BACL